MKQAILHIGTEKTGTTSIQSFLFAHRDLLARRGCLFPSTAGYVSNQRLVTYAKRVPDPDLVEPGLELEDARTLADWKEGFVVAHCNEVLPWLCARADARLVYSSEHMQSRVQDTEEIRRIARLVRPMVDEVRVIVYLRRQDRLALSAYSTTVRGGNARPFAFEDVNHAGPYYDQRALLERWASVFGERAITVRVFERARLVGGDVVDDFVDAAGIGHATGELARPPSTNEALSWTAQSILRAFNARPGDDPRLHGVDRRALRSHLLGELEGLADGFAPVRPARASARAFQAHFEEANREVAERWLGGRGFDDSFDEYPEAPGPTPVVADAEERLDALVDAWRARAARVE